MGTAVVRPRMRFDLYSHHIKVSGFDYQGKEALLEFCRSLVQYGMVRRGQVITREMLRVFVGVTKDRRVFHFHINQKQELLRTINSFGIDTSQIEMVEHKPYAGTPVGFQVKDTREPRDYQIPIVEYLVKTPPDTYAPSKMVELQTGRGKAQPLDALVRVPGGWKRMGDIVLNDRVISKDGTVTRVTGVYPQGEKEIFRVTFADGRSTECCAEHLWKVYYVNTVKHKRWRIVDTTEMLRLISMPNPRVYVDLIDPEDSKDRALPMDPYSLGVFLGDAHIGERSVVLSSEDEFILEQVRTELPQGLELRHRGGCDYGLTGARGNGANRYVDILRCLGLTNKLSHEKFVPKDYLEGSYQQRLAILQGLMDADGTVSADCGTLSFTSCSAQLARDVQYLVRSLGGIASISEKTKTFTYQGEKKTGRLAYQVNIRHKRPSEIFRLPRKVALCRDDNQYAETLKLRVKSIEPVGVKEAQCISVEHADRLYVTNDFIVTHNTFIALKAVAKLNMRTMLIIKGMYVDKWIEDVKEAFHLKPGDLMVVRGSKDLRKLIDLGLAGELEAKFIICTSKTMYMYFQEYERYSGEMISYDVSPADFYETLGVGVRIVDEAHQEFHTVYRLDLYSHVPLTISLSATLVSDDPFMNRMYATAWPMQIRSPKVEFDKYIQILNLWYSVNNPQKIRCKNFMKQYSHVMFEQSIMKNKVMMQNYREMLSDILRRMFVDEREPGQKALLFCATKEMCTTMCEALQQDFPDIKVGRYISEDDYSVLLESDLTVTTLKSAGTAVDVPNLKRVLCSVAVSSKQANEQAIGRLRRLKDWPKETPEFAYVSAREIDKHVSYAQEKAQKLDGKVLGFREYQTDYRI